MNDEPVSPIMRVSSTMRGQVEAVTEVLDALAARGLRVRVLPSGAWCWEWQGHTGVAAGLGSAIGAALDWYSGLAPDPDAQPPGEVPGLG